MYNFNNSLSAKANSAFIGVINNVEYYNVVNNIDLEEYILKYAKKVVAFCTIEKFNQLRNN